MVFYPFYPLFTTYTFLHGVSSLIDFEVILKIFNRADIFFLSCEVFTEPTPNVADVVICVLIVNK